MLFERYCKTSVMPAVVSPCSGPQELGDPSSFWMDWNPKVIILNCLSKLRVGCHSCRLFDVIKPLKDHLGKYFNRKTEQNSKQLY